MSSPRPIEKSPSLVTTEDKATAILRQSPFFRAPNLDIRFECRGDVLVVRGRVRTFYLKQLLQTVLRDVQGIRRIDNCVDVVCSQGLNGVTHCGS